MFSGSPTVREHSRVAPQCMAVKPSAWLLSRKQDISWCYILVCPNFQGTVEPKRWCWATSIIREVCWEWYLSLTMPSQSFSLKLATFLASLLPRAPYASATGMSHCVLNMPLFETLPCPRCCFFSWSALPSFLCTANSYSCSST